MDCSERGGFARDADGCEICQCAYTVTRGTRPPPTRVTLRPPVTSALVTSAVDAPQCLNFASVQDASGLLGVLQAVPDCGPLTQVFVAQIIPLMQTPDLIPGVILGQLDSNPGIFCRCMAALSGSGVASFFPVAGCVLGEIGAGDVVDQCAALSIDTRQQFCPLACAGDPTPRVFGANTLCCECEVGGGTDATNDCAAPTTTATIASTIAATTRASPPPTTSDGSCPRNCGTEANGGGTCRANGRCLSCNANRVLQSGRCYASIACKGRRIQSGSQAGSSCRCLDENCHYCNRAPAGDTCKVWPRVQCWPDSWARSL